MKGKDKVDSAVVKVAAIKDKGTKNFIKYVLDKENKNGIIGTIYVPIELAGKNKKIQIKIKIG